MGPHLRFRGLETGYFSREEFHSRKNILIVDERTVLQENRVRIDEKNHSPIPGTTKGAYSFKSCCRYQPFRSHVVVY